MTHGDSNRRVMHVVSSAELAGTERALLMLLQSADRAAFDHCVALPRHGPLSRALDALNAPCHIIAHPRCGPAYYLAFAQLLRRVRPALLHLHAERLHAAPARLLGIPVVERKNLTREPDHKTPSRSPVFDKFANRVVDMTIVPSEFLRRYYLDRGLTTRDRIFTIYNGIDTAPFDAPWDMDAARAALGLADSDIPVCAVGRLVPLKGVEDIINALPRVLEHEPAVKLVLIGDGPERAALERLAAEKGVAERVAFAGRRGDVPRLVRACRVLVHASHTEALSNAVLEAMAARTPVAASNIPGNAEVVEHEHTGLLFTPRDPAALADAVLRLIRDADLAARCAQNARALIEQQFSPQTMVQKTQAVYEKLLAHSTRGK